MKNINKQLLETLCVNKINEQEETHCVDKKLLSRVMDEVLEKVEDFAQAVEDIVALYFMYLSGNPPHKSILVDWSRTW